jgi:hypothetical protein
LAKGAERGAIDAAQGPVVHQPGSVRSVKTNSPFVPVKDHPFETAQVFPDAATGKPGEKLPTDALAAELWPDEEVL